MEALYRKVKTKREILKQAMSKPYCGGTRFEFLDDDERPLIYNAMEKYALQQIETLEAEKAELLEALVYANRMLNIAKDSMYDKQYIESLIQKHKP